MAMDNHLTRMDKVYNSFLIQIFYNFYFKELTRGGKSYKKVERVLIILTNSGNWDISNLKRWDAPALKTDKDKVTSLLHQKYNKVWNIF